MRKRAVSLSAEISELEGVVTAVRLVIDLLRFQGAGNDADERAVPYAASATLNLLAERLRDLGRVFRREKPVKAILAHYNAHVVDREFDKGLEDLVLPVLETATPTRRPVGTKRKTP